MKTSKLIFALGFIVASGVSGAAVAHDNKAERHEAGRHQQHNPIKQMLKGLELSESQRQQIRLLVQQHRTEHSDDRQRNAESEPLQALMQAEQFDEAVARQLLQQRQQKQLEQRLSALKLKHQVLQVLTTEQRAELDEKQGKWQQKRQSRQPV